MEEPSGIEQPLVDEDTALAAVRRLDAQLKAEYESQLRDADGLPVRPEALAVDTADRAIDVPEHVEPRSGRPTTCCPTGSPTLADDVTPGPQHDPAGTHPGGHRMTARADGGRAAASAVRPAMTAALARAVGSPEAVRDDAATASRTRRRVPRPAHPEGVVAPQRRGEVACCAPHRRRAAPHLPVRRHQPQRSGGHRRCPRGHPPLFREVEVLDDGARVRVQPGATLRAVNARLAPYGRSSAPTPRATSRARSAGSSRTTPAAWPAARSDNTYRTLESLVSCCPSGSVIDTGAPDADERLRALEPALHAGLAPLRDRVRGDQAPVGPIRAAVRDQEHDGLRHQRPPRPPRPARSWRHLLVGSEGTLGFVARAVLRTVPAVPFTRPPACSCSRTSRRPWRRCPRSSRRVAAAIELLDAASLRVAQPDPRRPAARPARGRARRAAGRVAGGRRGGARGARVRDADAAIAGSDHGARRRFTADAAAPRGAVGDPQGPVRGGRGRAPRRDDGAARGHRRPGAGPARTPVAR